MSYYDLLGVSKDASTAEIDKAYKIAVQRVAADRYAQYGTEYWQGANALQKLLNAAWETLRDYDKRAEYDKQNPNATAPTREEMEKVVLYGAEKHSSAADEGFPPPPLLRPRNAGEAYLVSLMNRARQRRYQEELEEHEKRKAWDSFLQWSREKAPSSGRPTPLYGAVEQPEPKQAEQREAPVPPEATPEQVPIPLGPSAPGAPMAAQQSPTRKEEVEAIWKDFLEWAKQQAPSEAEEEPPRMETEAEETVQAEQVEAPPVNFKLPKAPKVPPPEVPPTLQKKLESAPPSVRSVFEPWVRG